MSKSQRWSTQVNLGYTKAPKATNRTWSMPSFSFDDMQSHILSTPRPLLSNPPNSISSGIHFDTIRVATIYRPSLSSILCCTSLVELSIYLLISSQFSWVLSFLLLLLTSKKLVFSLSLLFSYVFWFHVTLTSKKIGVFGFWVLGSWCCSTQFGVLLCGEWAWGGARGGPSASLHSRGRHVPKRNTQHDTQSGGGQSPNPPKQHGEGNEPYKRGV